VLCTLRLLLDVALSLPYTCSLPPQSPARTLRYSPTFCEIYFPLAVLRRPLPCFSAHLPGNVVLRRGCLLAVSEPVGSSSMIASREGHGQVGLRPLPQVGSASARSPTFFLASRRLPDLSRTLPALTSNYFAPLHPCIIQPAHVFILLVPCPCLLARLYCSCSPVRVLTVCIVRGRGVPAPPNIKMSRGRVSRPALRLPVTLFPRSRLSRGLSQGALVR